MADVVFSGRGRSVLSTQLYEDPSPARPLVAIANRLPVTKGRGGWRTADGGLVTALKPALDVRGGAWIGWDGGAEDLPRRVEGLEIDLHPVGLSRSQVQGHYYGFSNRTLWPLLHDFVEQPIFDPSWWRVYVDVNQKFARETAAAVGSKPSTLWVHDYHLMLLPKMLRRAGVPGPIAFFLHTPFPAPELFGRLPWRKALLAGLLGSDMVGFHTDLYRQNFLRACREWVPDVKVSGSSIITSDGRRVRTAWHPISIDAAGFAKEAMSTEVEEEVDKLRGQFGSRRILLGVDRLDYTKGILERLRAVEVLLERRPELRRNVILVQIVVPSRDDVKEYRDLKAQIEQEVGRINGRFTEPGVTIPIHYIYRSISRRRMMAFYRLADVALVTPLKDGMNLVAKEFVTCQGAGGSEGALVLSEFAGAAEELTDAIKCNPFDLHGLATAIENALDMSKAERLDRMSIMAQTVLRSDVFTWVDAMLSPAEASPQPHVLEAL